MKNMSNEQKRPWVLYVKPSNKRFIILLQKDFVILAFLSRKGVEIHPALCICPPTTQHLTQTTQKTSEMSLSVFPLL